MDITDSEWEIMRVIWENDLTKSKDIILLLNKKMNWSPSTVKTLLNRLVKKNIIGYQNEKEKFLYYPLITERDAIQYKMEKVAKQIYEGICHRASTNFEFYGSDDMEYINYLSEGLESYYSRALEKYPTPFIEKKEIFIHKTYSSFKSAMGIVIDLAWARAGLQWGIIHISPKEVFAEIDSRLVLHHLVTQALILRINPNLPYWLQQGISAYESKWLTKDMIKSELKEKKKLIEKRIFNIEEFNFQIFEEQSGFTVSYTIIEFLEYYYGKSMLLEVIKKPIAFENLLNNDSEHFLDNWISYIRKEYGYEGN